MLVSPQEIKCSVCLVRDKINVSVKSEIASEMEYLAFIWSEGHLLLPFPLFKDVYVVLEETTVAFSINWSK